MGCMVERARFYVDHGGDFILMMVIMMIIIIRIFVLTIMIHSIVIKR